MHEFISYCFILLIFFLHLLWFIVMPFMILQYVISPGVGVTEKDVFYIAGAIV